jgi:hypothetical protein
MVTSRPRARTQDDGAVAVEFALVVPVIIFLTLGIIEFGLLMRDYVSVTNITREAVRVASSEPKKGLSTPISQVRLSHAGRLSDPLDWSFAYDASQVLATRGSALPSRSIDELWVYVANKEGFPLAAGAAPSSWATDTRDTFDGGCPTASCVRYRWDDADGTFFYRSGDWRPRTINACAGSDAAMSVGVYVRARHTSIVGNLIGTDMFIQDAAISKFEPMRNISCAGIP